MGKQHVTMLEECIIIVKPKPRLESYSKQSTEKILQCNKIWHTMIVEIKEDQPCKNRHKANPKTIGWLVFLTRELFIG